MALINPRCRARKTFRKFAFILIFGVFFSLLGTTCSSGESTPIFYTVKIPFLRDDIAMHIRKNDTVIDPVGKYNIGKITDVSYEVAKSENYSSEKNEMVVSECAGYCDVYITVSADGAHDGKIFRVGAYKLYAGKNMPIRLPDFCGHGVCVDVGKRQK